MKQFFRETTLNAKSREMLTTINQIVEEYVAQGYTLTLRQLYYQLVSRDIIPNQQREYKKISRLLTEGRMAGLVSWSAIEDRLRQVKSVPTWTSPASILRAAANQFQLDKLEDQSVYLEVWVEKDALSQVVEKAAKVYQVPVMVNRGYGSVSMVYDAHQRFYSAFRDGAEECLVLYLGDHDPSGLDMVRDLQSRVGEMLESYGEDYPFEVRHIALTQQQIAQYNPPPNPTKLTDTRSDWYISEYGMTCWEVDALDPATLNALITDEIEQVLDLDKFDEIKEEEKKQKAKILDFVKNFE